MSNPIVITRELVKRGWSDFEPKLITGLLTGSAAAFIVSMLSTYGIHLSGLQENFVSVACFFLGGYLTPSTGTAVTKRIDAGLAEVEQHSGPVMTTVTAPTPVQKPATLADQVAQVQQKRASFTEIVDPAPRLDGDRPTSNPTLVQPKPDDVPTVNLGSWNR